MEATRVDGGSFANRNEFERALEKAGLQHAIILDGMTKKGGAEPPLEYVTLNDGKIVLKADAPA